MASHSDSHSGASSEANSGPLYVCLHVCVRNDDSCPRCRTATMYFTRTYGQACEIANDMIREDCIRERNPIDCLHGGYCWTDEWERRRNGDSYSVFKIEHGESYNVLKDLWGNTSSGSPDTAPTTHLLVRTKIRPRKWCPKNYRYFASFHPNVESVTSAALQLVKNNIDHLNELLEDQSLITESSSGKEDRYAIYELHSGISVDVTNSEVDHCQL